MERRIGIRSDYDTLKSLHKEIKKAYLECQIQLNKEQVKYLLISAFSIIITYLLISYKKDLIILTILSILAFLTFFSKLIYTLIKELIHIIKYDNAFMDLTKTYQGLAVVYYSVTQDTLKYDGPKKESYNWDEFKEVITYPNSFWLVTDKIERSVWIPNSAMIDPKDYDYFKEFAEMKIKSRITSQPI